MTLEIDDPPIEEKKKPARKANPKLSPNASPLDMLRAKFANPEIKKLMERCQTSWGKGSIILGENLPTLHCISTGLVSLDAILGSKGKDRRGIPRGFYTEISGENSAGKSLLAKWIVIQFQRHGLAPGYVNVESPMDLEHMRELGVDFEHLVLIEAKFGERAVAAFTAWAPLLDLMVLDSIGALYSIKQIQEPTKTGKLKEKGPENVTAARTKLVNQCLLNTIDPMAKKMLTFIGINQVRDSFGNFSWAPEKGTTGGNFLKHFQMLHLQCWFGGQIKAGSGDDAQTVGRYVGVTIKKTKMGIERKTTKLPFFYLGGFSPEYDAIEFGLKNKVVKKHKTTLVFGGVELGIGKLQAKDFLENHPDVMRSLWKACEEVGVGEAPTEEDAPTTVADFSSEDIDMILPDDLVNMDEV